MCTKEMVIETYFKYLSASNLKGVISLFEVDATIHSPMYGVTNASSFYKELFNDTERSEINLLNVFKSVKNEFEWTALIEFDWRMKNGIQYKFECVDLFKFGGCSLIKELIIIYDTFPLQKDLMLEKKRCAN